jgi:hypothetical protein
MSENPFESTSNEAAYGEPEPESDLSPPRSRARIVTYWIVVCSVSAIPSFLMGLDVVQPPGGVPAMVVGVLLFIGAYVLLDVRYLEPLARRKRNFRTAMQWGFGLRATASLLLPAGIMLDMLPGLLSVTIVRTIFPVPPGSQLTNSFPYEGGSVLGFFPALLTTLLQGVIMNALLWPVILALYAALDFFRGKDARPDET